MKEQSNSQHERVIFIDNDTGKSKFCLYRKIEEVESMTHLWKEFLRTSQSVRDQIDVNILDSALSEEEVSVINIKNNYHIFSTLITSKEELRLKNNLDASTNNAQRNKGETFTRKIVIAIDSEILRSRASNLRKKAVALKKQAKAYC